MLSVQKNYGLPCVRLESPVDAVGFRFHIRHEIVIALEVTSTGSANLHECELALVARVLLQKTLNGQKTLQNTFCVIDPVYAHTHKGSLNSQGFEQRRTFDIRNRCRLRRAHICEVHTDGERLHQGEMVQTSYRKVFPIDTCFQYPVHCLQEVVAM